MQFIHTIDKVLSGEKTLTSRIVKPRDVAFGDDWKFNIIAAVTNSKGRIRWQIGRTYAVQPGRGLASKGRIELLTIRQYDVRDITADEARREGFESELEFWQVWCGMHDKQAFNCVAIPIYHEAEAARRHLKGRLDNGDNVDSRYAAWQLGFKLITE